MFHMTLDLCPEEGVPQPLFWMVGKRTLSRACTGKDRRNGSGGPCYSREMFYDSLNPDTGLRHLGTAAKGGDDSNLKASQCSEVRSWAWGALGLSRRTPPARQWSS